MDSQFPSFPLLSSIFLVFLALITTIITTRKSKHLPPGPWKIPILGNIHNIIGCLPHRSLHNLSMKHGPLMHLQLGQVNTIVISSPETAKQVLKTHDLTFTNRPFSLAADIISYGSTDLVYAPYGDYWRQLRKICILELLSVKRVQSFRSIREEEMMNILRLVSGSEGSGVNFSKMLHKYMFSVISRAAFGKVRKEHEVFFPYVKEIMEVAAGFSLADLFPAFKVLRKIGGLKGKMERIHEQADKILEAIIKDHRARKGMVIGEDEDEDLVDVLLKLQDEGNLEFSLTIDNIKAVILDIFVAGIETSSTTMEWAMAELLKNPRIMKKAQTEVRQVFNKKGHVEESGLEQLTYLKLVIKESLRLHPPFPLLLPRESRDKCEINGYKIPTNTNVLINAWTIGRDPKYWEQAEEFIPERFSDGKIDYKGVNFEFIPFGGGRRICPGMNFGIVNVELPLANLLYHFDWKLPGGMKHEDLHMNEAYGIAVKRDNDLDLIPVVSHPVVFT
ncbi:desmethyl-deoxy-podophyllotoxin synthase-like [Euphorbia lathyris]|uniref:desmethyl-deoxy-podophyllotoxin synthase-like n=1 Tax=Euphorbia lathyris TaxID=212925 RepID=UPI0033130FA9